MTSRDLSSGSASKFLVTGCQRSGTTLLALALEAHPKIEIIEENDNRFHQFGALTRELIIDAVASHFASVDSILGFKAPRDTHRIQELFDRLPDLKIIWVERDIYQVVSSMLTLGEGQNQWARKFAPREIDKFRNLSCDEKIEQFLNSVSYSTESASIDIATICWILKRRQSKIAADIAGENLIKIEYDQIINNPELTLRSVLDFLHLTWNNSVLDHTNVVDGGVRPGNTDPKRTIDAHSLKKWRSRLTSANLERIGQIHKLADELLCDS